MKFNKDYFYIDIKHLKNKIIFPFQLYIYNDVNNQHTLYLHANSPLESKKKLLLEYIIDKGATLAISRKQIKTFLIEQSYKESDIPSLAQTTEHQLEKNQKMYLYLYEKRRKDNPFIFQDELKKADRENDFTQLIEEARAEILTFDVTTNETVSLSIYLAEDLLIEDNYTNRIVAVSYFLAKILNIKDQEALADLVTAAFLAHIGLTQVERSVFNGNLNEIDDRTKNQYQKHAALSQHLLRKCGVKLSDRCVTAIIEHHERADGSGYPNNKVEEYIEPLALVIGAVSHIFEHTAGHYDGSNRSFSTVIANIKNRSLSSGLELEFGDKMLDAIDGLFK